jgi:hypothetical protein
MLTSPRPVLVVVAITVLAVAASGFLTASSTRRAEASCSGGGAPAFVNHFDASSTLVAQEYVTYPGTTCNGDAAYSGAVLDPVTDGSCAYVYYLEPLAYYAQQGVSCTTGAWSVYAYTDTIGPNSVFVSARPSYLLDEWRFSTGY